MLCENCNTEIVNVLEDEHKDKLNFSTENLVYAESERLEEDSEFQNYVYADGTRVKIGDIVGIEKDDKFLLFDDIYYAND